MRLGLTHDRDHLVFRGEAGSFAAATGHVPGAHPRITKNRVGTRVIF
jgi:hypothetical protein